MVIVDGDDELVGNKVFSLISSTYQSKKPAVSLFKSFQGRIDRNDYDVRDPLNLTR